MSIINTLALSGRIKVYKLPISTQAKAGQGRDGYITGVVTELGLGVARRVMCYHRLSGALVSSTISEADGYYRFDGLIAGVKYYITSVDESKGAVQYNAVTQDLIIASEVAL